MLKTLDNDQKVKTNKDKQKFNSFKKIRRKFKIIIFFLVYLILFAAITTVGGYLIYNNQFSYSNSTFNPDANLNNWNDYYNKHQKDHQLIDVTDMTAFLGNHNISIVIANGDDKKNKLNFNNFMAQIDAQLINNNLEAKDIVNENDKLLPNNFIQNVIYNPSVNFTVKNDSGKYVNAENYAYSMDDIQGKTKTYSFLMNISKDATFFGININKDTNVAITVDITNNILFDLKDIKVNFKNEIISTENAKMTVTELLKENPFIETNIRNQFTKVLTTQIAAQTIPNDAYKISYVNPDAQYDFNDKKNDKVKFTIASNDKGKSLGFTGTTQEWQIEVTNTQVTLSNETDLITKITDSSVVKHLEVAVKNTADNDDTNLSQDQVKDINDQLNKALKPICDEYFSNKYKGLNITDADYDISSNLSAEDNITNGKTGKEIKLTIAPSDKTQKFVQKNELTGINIKIYGKNSDYTTKTWNLPTNFAKNFEGIWLEDDKTNHYLQDGEHNYSQTNLLNQLINSSEKNSLGKIIQNNSYDVKGNSFTGNFNIMGKIDGNDWTGPISFDVSKVSNPNKGISNFLDLINKTKNIYLYTNVQNADNSRTLNNVKINFYDSDSLDASSLIYTFDLTSVFKGEAISEAGEATLDFTSFSTNDIKYSQQN